MEQEAANVNLNNFAEATARFQARIIEQVRNIPDVQKTAKRSVAVVGNVCAGKTTLLNKLYNLQLETKPMRNTSKFTKVHETGELEVYDVFGQNDRETYIGMQTLLKMKAVHNITCLYTDAVEQALDVAEVLKALRSNSSQPFSVVFVRNKMESEQEHFEAIYNNDLAELQALCPGCQLVLASNRSGLGHTRILQAISEDRQHGQDAQHAYAQPAQIGMTATTSGTDNPNGALGNVFNTRGQTNSRATAATPTPPAYGRFTQPVYAQAAPTPPTYGQLEAFFCSLHIPSADAALYTTKLKEDGFDVVSDLKDMSEEDFKEIGMKKGHMRKVMRAAQTCP